MITLHKTTTEYTVDHYIYLQVRFFFFESPNSRCASTALRGCKRAQLNNLVAEHIQQTSELFYEVKLNIISEQFHTFT